jgi:hypothetical protein
VTAFHELLVYGRNFVAAEQQALRFFARNILVRYEEVQVLAAASCSGRDPAFRGRLAAGMAENRQRAAGLLAELQETGLSSLAQFRELPQGYESKLLHTLAHLLDGFFGIDSFFYNLLDDSHWVPEKRDRQIEINPDDYWLLRVAVRTGNSGESFAGLRRLANNPGK